ncbi:MAG: S8 family serine peptidase [Pseudomonadota bacterium]
MKQNYTILRMPPERQNTESAQRDGEAEDNESLINLEHKNLDADEAEEMRRDSSCIVAQPMTLSLIEPTKFDKDVRDTKDTWGLKAIGAPDSEYTGKGSTVAILDTGIRDDHIAFDHINKENIVQKDFTDTGNGDTHGHGTHIAATIFGKSISGLQVGVAPNIDKAYIAKVLDKTGKGSTGGFYDGLKWAIDQNVDVVCMSLGFDFLDQIKKIVKVETATHEQATSKALVEFAQNLRTFDALVASVETKKHWETGTVIVAAAGNESNADTKIAATLPSATRGIISVGAIKQPSSAEGSKYTVPSFSNILPDVVAPGVGIVSARADGGVAIADGTSQACPHVAGVAALWWEYIRNSQMPTEAAIVREHLLASCRFDEIETEVRVEARGRGLVTAP